MSIGGEVILDVFLIEGVHLDLTVVQHEGHTIVDLSRLLLLALDARVESLALFLIAIDQGQIRFLPARVKQWQFLFLHGGKRTSYLCFF